MDRNPSDSRGVPTAGRPPLSARAVLLAAALLTAALAAVVLTVVHLPGPLDEQTLADQRNGLLRGGPTLPTQVEGVTLGGDPVVLLFVRTAPRPGDVRAFAAALPARARLRVVVQAPPPAETPALPAPVTVDPAGVLARAVDLPRPRDGGPGVGYAVVDPDRVVQYATLDPSWPTNGSRRSSSPARRTRIAPSRSPPSPPANMCCVKSHWASIWLNAA